MVNNKNVIVTGTNRGIGKAIVQTFAQNGANVWACARNNNNLFEDWCNKISEENNVWVKPVYFDFEDFDKMKKAFLKIKQEKQDIDILVNVAGIVENATYLMTSQKSLNKIFEVNYFSQIQFTQYITKIMMRQKKGSIVNIASSAGIDANVGRTAYNASKAAVISTTKTMSKELGNYNIRVNAVAPGLTNTDMAIYNTPKDVMDYEIQHCSLKRIGEPNEIANVVVFLASDLASYVTGQVWRVDGGL